MYDDYLIKFAEYLWLLISGLCVWFYRRISKLEAMLLRQEVDNVRTFVSHEEFRVTLDKFEANQEKLMHNLNTSVSELKQEVRRLNDNLLEVIKTSR